MIKSIANKFRSHCGTVQQIVSRQGKTSQTQKIHPVDKPRLPDCSYVLHAGIASTQRNSSS